MSTNITRQALTALVSGAARRARISAGMYTSLMRAIESMDSVAYGAWKRSGAVCPIQRAGMNGWYPPNRDSVMRFVLEFDKAAESYTTTTRGVLAVTDDDV